MPLAAVNGGTGDAGTAWTAYTPAVTALSGTFTSASATGRYKLLGKTCFISVQVNVVTAGTAAGATIVTLPGGVTIGANLTIVGREVAVNGAAVTASLGPLALTWLFRNTTTRLLV